MTIVTILNLGLIALVVLGIVGLLGAAIWSQRDVEPDLVRIGVEPSRPQPRPHMPHMPHAHRPSAPSGSGARNPVPLSDS